MKNSALPPILRHLGIALLALPLLASAADLSEIYQQALSNDPQLRAAQAAYRAGRESEAIGRAGLLPQLNASAGYSETDTDSTSSRFSSFVGGGATLVSEEDNSTDTTSYSLSLTQPLFDLPAWYDYKQGKVVSEQARIRFAADQQDLILRVAEAYFNVLRASENLTTAMAEQEAIGRQLEQTKQRHQVGLLPITDVHEAQASYDDAAVNTLVFRGELQVAFEALEVLTGQPYHQLAGLGAEFPVADPEPAQREDWVRFALDNNLDLHIARLDRDAAEMNASARKSEHLPTITGSYSYQKTDEDGTSSGVSSNVPQPWRNTPNALESDTQVAAINLQMPIFSGGLISAQRRQARQQYLQADELLTAQQRNTTQQARTAHLNVVTNAARVNARAQAITSAESALKATRAGYQVGTRNIVDVLIAERNLYQAKRNYASARYDYITSTLNLKDVAGQLSPDDIHQLNAWLDPTLSVTPTQ